MNRLASIILLLVVIVFSYFAYYNQEVVTLKLWRGRMLELPVMGTSQRIRFLGMGD